MCISMAPKAGVHAWQLHAPSTAFGGSYVPNTSLLTNIIIKQTMIIGNNKFACFDFSRQHRIKI